MTYRLTHNPEMVISIEENALIPKGHAFWAHYEAWVAAGNTPEPAGTESIAACRERLTAVVQRHLDSTAQTRGYDGILSACSYVTSTNATFEAEGKACLVWRDAVWTRSYEVLAEVQSGSRAIPSEQELLELLPQIQW